VTEVTSRASSVGRRLRRWSNRWISCVGGSRNYHPAVLSPSFPFDLFLIFGGVRSLQRRFTSCLVVVPPSRPFGLAFKRPLRRWPLRLPRLLGRSTSPSLSVSHAARFHAARDERLLSSPAVQCRRRGRAAAAGSLPRRRQPSAVVAGAARNGAKSHAPRESERDEERERAERESERARERTRTSSRGRRGKGGEQKRTRGKLRGTRAGDEDKKGGEGEEGQAWV